MEGGNSEEIEKHLGLVGHLTKRARLLAPADVEANDLFQEGVIGLIDALSRYDSTRGYKVSSYVVPRIIGQIRDYLRTLGLAQFRGRAGSRELEWLSPPWKLTPIHLLWDERTRFAVRDELMKLPLEDQKLMWLCFVDDLNLHEIAKHLDREFYLVERQYNGIIGRLRRALRRYVMDK